MTWYRTENSGGWLPPMHIEPVSSPV